MPGPGSKLTVSLCICTYNRARQLREVLSRVAALTIPDDIDYEVVIVDNNSTDGTPGVIREASSSLPIRTARELTPGVAWARNAAVALARGELLLWIDDDVLVEPDWAMHYIREAREHPDTGFFGGPVRAHLEGVPPVWVLELLPLLRSPFALREYPPSVETLGPFELPFGANFASRRAVHQQVPFNTGLGRVGRKGGCLEEETEFFRGALRAGHSGRWVHECLVLHAIPAERQTTKYLHEYYRLVGVTPPEKPEKKDHTPRLFGRPRWLWREWLQNEAVFRILRYTASPERWYEHLKRAAIARGILTRLRE